ncbi:hypothetical protein [Bradyrhizobium lablabi]|uniref:hypothetical protein n=1 Tax=Bradyrhizobium lablabi TaxID=722472 RepID=UPI001BA5A377|nr:hypothetical protein [Bradyrhizobium lablabi]MBR0693647.1 hypothetical protein [Bradyrhizobium lablabi]
MHRVYCFSGQSASVRALLDQAGLGTETGGIQAVNEARHLAGLSGGTFAYVKNHRNYVPPAMLEMVAACGMNVITLSDEYARARALRRAIA